jgi:hypothetical protein
MFATLFLATAIGGVSLARAGGVDCTPLDPRSSVSKEVQLKANASAQAIYRTFKAGGSLEGSAKEQFQNLQTNAPASESEAIKLRVLYLFCGMVANDPGISAERKLELLQKLMNAKDESAKPKVIVAHPTRPIVQQLAQGGKGGNATALGDGAVAVGGNGGGGGTGGNGGDGGGGVAVGNNAKVYGGDGGQAGQPDGSGGRGGDAHIPPELKLLLPPNAGKGGDGGRSGVPPQSEPTEQ